jgi:hypothetical protein
VYASCSPTARFKLAGTIIFLLSSVSIPARTSVSSWPHVPAVTAVAKGSAAAKWLAAVTMDRYLQTINQPQVFGT